MLLDGEEPATYRYAIGSTDSEAWLGAMRSEIKFIDDNQVWNLVDLPDGARSIECKWVFKRKTDQDKKKLSTNRCLSRRGSDKFKELTTMRLSHR